MKKSVLPIGWVNFVILTVMFSPAVRAEQYHIWNIPEVSSSFAGGYTALSDNPTGPPYEYAYDGTNDWIFFEPTTFSFLSIFDTGASGIILSKAHTTSLGVATTGEEYTDIGIGGYETFDVSVPTYFRLALTNLVVEDYSAISNPDNYTNYGQFKAQVSRNEQAMYNVIGTPVLAQRIMRVNLDDWRDISLTSMLVFADTEFLSAMPSVFAGPRAFPIQLRMDYFVEPGAPISAEANPMIPGVRIRDRRQSPDNQSTPKDWLFDTGAQFTMIGWDYAMEIGINPETEEPFDFVEITGIGGTIMIYGYIVDELIVPVVGGDELVFHNVIAFVPEQGALPADLTGIFGMNLLSGNLVEVGEDLGIEPNFLEWFFDGPGETLTLVPDFVTVRGTVNLRDYLSDVAAVPLTFEVREPDNVTAVETHVVYPDATGQFEFLTTLKGNGDLAVKAPHWLRQKQSVTLASPSLTVDFDLVNGDSDGDNEITTSDLANILFALDTLPGDPFWIPEADLDGDGEVTTSDLATLLLNLDRMGDE